MSGVSEVFTAVVLPLGLSAVYEVTLSVVGGCEQTVRRAAALLPAADRDRYLGEYRSELHDLTEGGASRFARGLWALRVLVRAPLLRRELRKPRRERAR